MSKEEIIWITVYKTIDPTDAQLMRISLENNGFDPAIENEGLLDSPAPSFSTFAPLNIQVPSYQSESAKKTVEKILRLRSKRRPRKSHRVEAIKFLKFVLLAFAIFTLVVTKSVILIIAFAIFVIASRSKKVKRFIAKIKYSLEKQNRETRFDVSLLLKSLEDIDAGV